MFYILLFISVLIFGIIWTIITNKYLPSETLDTKNTDRTGYDERQRTMFLEIFSKTFVGLVYTFFIGMILKYSLYTKDIIRFIRLINSKLAYILIVALLLVMNYFIVKKIHAIGLIKMKNKIREYRKQMGMSQDTLSKNVNVSRQTVNAIENNKYDPTLQLAFKLAKQFNTTVDDLFNP